MRRWVSGLGTGIRVVVLFLILEIRIVYMGGGFLVRRLVGGVSFFIGELVDRYIGFRV